MKSTQSLLSYYPVLLSALYLLEILPYIFLCFLKLFNFLFPLSNISSRIRGLPCLIHCCISGHGRRCSINIWVLNKYLIMDAFIESVVKEYELSAQLPASKMKIIYLCLCGRQYFQGTFIDNFFNLPNNLLGVYHDSSFLQHRDKDAKCFILGYTVRHHSAGTKI